jgi:hypothetical protein
MNRFLFKILLTALSLVFVSAFINPARAQYPLEDTIRVKHQHIKPVKTPIASTDSAKNNNIPGNPDNTNVADREFLFIHGQYLTITDHTSNIKFHEAFGAEAGLGFLLDRKAYQKTYLVATAAYNLFPVLANPSSPSNTKTESYIPVRIGVRTYLIPHLIYVNADAGGAIIGNSYNTVQTPNPSSLRLTADIGVGIIAGGFEAGITMDTFKEPSPDGWTGCVVLKAGWRFGW